jgi:hypothetical protein
LQKNVLKYQRKNNKNTKELQKIPKTKETSIPNMGKGKRSTLSEIEIKE